MAKPALKPQIAGWRLARHKIPSVFSYRYQRRIGLLGGSFNPAHNGHISLSKQALMTAGCDEIWWLVSPQNPLKSPDQMADYDKRLSYARQLAAPHPWLKVLDLEAQIGTHYSYDVIRYLQTTAPRASFLWLIGTDNLRQLPRWYRARDMIRLVPFVAFRRKSCFYEALASQGRGLFRQTTGLKHPNKAPKLHLVTSFEAPQSATSLRAQGFWQKSRHTGPAC